MKRVIWTNEVDAIENLRDEILQNPEDYYELTAENAWNRACEQNDDYLEDEKVNLNIEVGNEILIIADLGLWDGRHQAYKLLRKTNIADCLGGLDDDYLTWFIDDLGDLRCKGVHHDGTNYYTYRAWKSGISQTAKDNLLGKIYYGKATRRDITRVTRKIGTYVSDVYGWPVRR